MALLGLGPAFKRLVPAPAVMSEMTRTAVAIGETMTQSQEAFYHAICTLHYHDTDIHLGIFSEDEDNG
jgi:hypothetical protein